MALSKLSGDEQGIIFSQLCNVLDPRVAVDFSSTGHELHELTQPLRQQLRADHEVAAALCPKLGMRSCKELREAHEVEGSAKDLTATDLTTLGSLGSVLPVLESLLLGEVSAACSGWRGMERLAAGLGAGSLPALTSFSFYTMRMDDAGASAFAAALGRGAMLRLKTLYLEYNDIGNAGLLALAPALRRLPALEELGLHSNPLGDEGLAALVAPLPPAGVPPQPTGGLAKLEKLDLSFTQIAGAGSAALVAAFDSGALPALKALSLLGYRSRSRATPDADYSRASAAAFNAVYEASSRTGCVLSPTPDYDSDDYWMSDNPYYDPN